MMQQQRQNFWFPLFITVGLSAYQLFLCFLNTHGLAINNTIVAAAEGALLLAATLKVLTRKNITELALPAFVTAYFILLWALRESIDPQGIRNLFIIYVMFSLGQQTSNLKTINRIVWALSIVAVIFCVFEYFFIDIYLSTFNILQYYMARGMVSEDQLGWTGNNLWISGTRMSGRTMLPFLGDQRVSSIFLEPVSMGNYAVIVGMWALSFDLKDWRKSIGHYFAAAFFIIASDSRFASFIIGLLFVVRFFPLAQKAWALYALPFFVAFAEAYFAQLRIGDWKMDDMPGRLTKGGDSLLAMPLTEIFGIGSPDEYYDMGIPYSLVVFGVALCAFLWIKLVVLRFDTKQGVRMRAMLTIYCLGLLLISGTSFFSSKTAGLLWLILGALYQQDKETARLAAEPAVQAPYPSEPSAQTATNP